jgi:prepilin-type N-terminal cleavage/methylation domain-containing protein
MSPENSIQTDEEAAGDRSVKRRGEGAPRHRAEGFTLLEVMVSLMILTLVLAVSYSSFTTALTSWSAGLNRGRKEQVARIALGRMAQQLKSAVPATITEEGGRRRPAFEGGEDHIRFVTVLPVGIDPLPVQVSYSIEEIDGENRMVYREYPWPDKNFFEIGEPVREESVDEIVGMAITLRPREEKGENGENEGSDTPRDEEDRPQLDEDEMPGGVDISLRLEGDEDDRHSISVSLQSEPWR